MDRIQAIINIISPHLMGKHKTPKALELSIKILEVLGLPSDTPPKKDTNQD